MRRDLSLCPNQPSTSCVLAAHSMSSACCSREKDIIILSCVRAPKKGSQEDSDKAQGGIGFVDDWRRLNVAITRAKHSMWIVGHAGVLKQSSEWRELISDCKRRGTYVDDSSKSQSGGRSAGAADARPSKDRKGKYPSSHRSRERGARGCRADRREDGDHRNRRPTAAYMTDLPIAQYPNDRRTVSPPLPPLSSGYHPYAPSDAWPLGTLEPGGAIRAPLPRAPVTPGYGEEWKGSPPSGPRLLEPPGLGPGGPQPPGGDFLYDLPVAPPKGPENVEAHPGHDLRHRGH